MYLSADYHFVCVLPADDAETDIPWYMTGIIFVSLVISIICILVNLKCKLSEHMAGMGGIIGGLVSFSALFSYNPVVWLCLFILIAGILGSAGLCWGITPWARSFQFCSRAGLLFFDTPSGVQPYIQSIFILKTI